MNYVIWKDIDSRSIKGLLISELPPITKPKMRVQETTIDGVDGSIIEELGYESYDKPVKIGLHGNFNIDEVIKYFTGEGQLVFSNEPDKYYNAKIIGQIDYERLLRYREATVKFRVQPFKYKCQEDYELSDKEIEGITCKIEGYKLTKISIEGNSTQETRSGKNKLPYPYSEVLNGVEDLGNGKLIVNGTITENDSMLLSITTLKTGTYRFTANSNVTNGYYINIYKASDDSSVDRFIKHGSTFTLTNDIEVKIRLVVSSGIYDNLLLEPMIALSTEDEIYEQYGSTPTPETPSEIKNIGTYNEETGKYEINITNGTDTIKVQLDEPLRSVPNGVKDIAYISGNKLYVDRYVGSVILNGSEEWSLDGNIDNLYRYKIKNSFLVGSVENSGLSNYFKYESNYQGTEPHFYLNNVGSHFFFINITTLEQFITWLSENNVEVIYELAEPITENIGELTMFDLTEGKNNISNSENANMIINYHMDNLVATNIGNHIAKPIIEIKGSGTVEILVNGIAVFTYTFPDGEDTVVIDSQKQDAYLGTVLKNRNMIGEFPVFEIGENAITWNGSIESFKISKQSRWL